MDQAEPHLRDGLWLVDLGARTDMERWKMKIVSPQGGVIRFFLFETVVRYLLSMDVSSI